MNIKNFIQKVGSIFFPNMSKGPESILTKKGNQIHVFLIYLAGIYMLMFGIINYFLDAKASAAYVNFASLPLIAIVYIFYRIGWTILSKLLNLTLILAVIILIFLLTRSAQGLNNGDSILAFFIPVFIGAMIIFQGKERRIGVFFAIFVLVLMTFLILSDLHLGDSPPYTREQVRRELALNIIGSAFATMIEVYFIMLVSNTIDAELIKANSELDRFVYSVSHDLRSPLLSIKGLSGLMKDEETTGSKNLQYLNLIDKSINNLDDTIREILAYSRNSRLEIDQSEFDLKLLVDDIFDELRYSTGINFQFISNIATSTTIVSDRSRMETVLRNVIGNAVKYRRTDIDDPFVSVQFIKQGSQYRFTIEDNGIGIAQENTSKVFDMFYRGVSNVSGTGLGLYICKEIMDKFKGKILLLSEPGKGTSVKLIFPQIV
jgi:signal transduction histidine kinase